jgi:hypothetical protein
VDKCGPGGVVRHTYMTLNPRHAGGKPVNRPRTLDSADRNAMMTTEMVVHLAI